MALPPKNDDDTPSGRTAAGDAAPKKARPTRSRSRATKPADDKATKPVKRARRGSVTKAEQGEFAAVVSAPETAPAPRTEPVFRAEPPAPAPIREEPRPAPAPEAEAPRRVEEFRPEPAPERGYFAPASAPSESSPGSPRDDAARAPEPSGSAAPEAHEVDAGDAREHDGGGRPPQHQQQGHRGDGHGGGQHGHPQHGGGGGGGGGRGDDRFWKHGKRKRGRHGGGGHWQPGQQGGGHGGREQLPQQLPPPSPTVVFGDLPNPSRFNDLAALDTLAGQLAAGEGESIQLNQIYAKTLADLATFARGQGVPFEGVPNKRQLLTEIFKFAAEKKRPLRDTGYIDQNDRGCFIVHEHVNYRLYPEDAYLPDSLVKRFGLKRGHRVEVLLQPPLEGDRCPSVVRVESVMGLRPDDISKVTPFEELVPYYPLKRILLEDPDVVKDVSMRAVDILTPIGFGQRGLIVAPPRTGKTILLQNIANSISANSPEVKLILLLIDERPEEVTDFRRHTKGEVVSSTFDETPENHVHCAEMVIEICRRRVEQGEHVVILLDSITRLARAYNALTSGGKTMSGGLESNALQKPKRFFGSARNIEGGGSLTIIASALIDTGSRMDEIIFEEFKGTGNSELHLDRGLVERRIFPAINIDRSGTRKEELLYHPDELQRIFSLRRAMQGLGPIESMEMLITRLKKTKSNTEFLLSLAPK
jgi:transcription termination factor Rho